MSGMAAQAKEIEGLNAVEVSGEPLVVTTSVPKQYELMTRKNPER